MENFILDCTGMDNHALHRALAETLSLPDWYGCNLDALMDCLTDLEQPTSLCLTGWDTLEDWKAGFAQVFADAARENPDFTVSFE